MKCAIEYCVNHVGSIRAKRTKLCYTCERNIGDWEKRGIGRMLNWQRRVKMFSERLERISKAQPTRAVLSYVRKESEKRSEG